MDAAFIRIETFGRRSASRKRLTIKRVIAEAARLKGGCAHLDNPMPPRAVYGAISDVVEAPAMIGKLVELSEAESGKKVRSNLHLLLAGVASYPRTIDDMLESREEFAEYQRWIGLTMDFLKAEYGDNLFAVLEHRDEPHGHLHFIVLPTLAPDWTISVNHFHPGKVAEKTADSGADRLVKYKGAMLEFQDRFHALVGSKMGWVRNPANKRKRRSKKEQRAMANRKQSVDAERLAEVLLNPPKPSADLIALAALPRIPTRKI